jgi:hypothetical protein
MVLRPQIVLCGFFSLFAASAQPAQADPIVIFNDLRAARTVGKPSPNSSVVSQTATAGGALSSAIVVSDGPTSGRATATLTSSFADPMHWSGGGASDVSWTATTHAVFFASAVFDVGFRTTAPLAYSFDADLLQSHTDLDSRSRSFALVTLRHHPGASRRSQMVFGFETGPQNPSAVSRSFVGLLAPGTYSLVVAAISDGFGQGTAAATSSYNFTLDFAAADAAPIPEPSTLLLLATGLAAGVRWHHRKQH